MRVRNDLHLNEVDWFVVLLAVSVPPGTILLRMENSVAGGHPLCQTRVDDAVLSGGVLVDEGTQQHPDDDFGVPVWMRLESAFRRDDIVVAGDEQAMVGVCGIVVVGE